MNSISVCGDAVWLSGDLCLDWWMGDAMWVSAASRFLFIFSNDIMLAGKEWITVMRRRMACFQSVLMQRKLKSKMIYGVEVEKWSFLLTAQPEKESRELMFSPFIYSLFENWCVCESHGVHSFIFKRITFLFSLKPCTHLDLMRSICCSCSGFKGSWSKCHFPEGESCLLFLSNSTQSCHL